MSKEARCRENLKVLFSLLATKGLYLFSRQKKPLHRRTLGMFNLAKPQYTK